MSGRSQGRVDGRWSSSARSWWSSTRWWSSSTRSSSSWCVVVVAAGWWSWCGAGWWGWSAAAGPGRRSAAGPWCRAAVLGVVGRPGGAGGAGARPSRRVVVVVASSALPPALVVARLVAVGRGGRVVDRRPIGRLRAGLHRHRGVGGLLALRADERGADRTEQEHDDGGRRGDPRAEAVVADLGPGRPQRAARRPGRGLGGAGQGDPGAPPGERVVLEAGRARAGRTRRARPGRCAKCCSSRHDPTLAAKPTRPRSRVRAASRASRSSPRATSSTDRASTSAIQSAARCRSGRLA